MVRNTAALLLLALVPLGNAGSFMGTRPEVDPAYIHLVVQGALSSVLGNGHGVGKSRIAGINATLAPLFSVLPKNRHGRLSVPFMRYAVQRYFSQRHGWIVKGFEPYADNKMNDTMSSQHIMQSKVPGYVESVLQNKLSHDGFDVQDMTIAIAAIEALIFDENLKGLEAAYHLNKWSTDKTLTTEEQLMEVLISYFIVEHLDGESTDLLQHESDKENIHLFYPHWLDTLMFIEDVSAENEFVSSHLANPFMKQKAYSFEDVASKTRLISEHFGPFSNHECHDMKLKLAEMDGYKTGRVRLSDFYRSAQDGAWQFLENPEYLGTIGALDTSSSSIGPQVIIPNYIVSHNNCISSSLYYDVCCLNECDGIFQHLEAKIGKPTASVAEITAAIEGGITLAPVLSSSAPTEPRKLNGKLRSRLQKIAEHHSGDIPMHGRLFAQWLHYAFPWECPFPHKSGTVSPQVLQALKASGVSLEVSDEEISEYVQSEFGQRPLSPRAGLSMWTMDEELLGTGAPQASLGSMLRLTVHVVMLAGFSGMVLKELLRLSQAREHKKDTTPEVTYDI